MPEKEIICPWCNEKTVTTKNILKKANSQVKERRCTNCEKILAAYTEDEKDFLPKIRVFD
jgi:hypothetical protein